MFVHHTRAPLDFVIPTTPGVPSCSEPSRTKALRWRLRAILDRSCARRPWIRAGRGEETGFQVEQRNWKECSEFNA